MRNGSVLTRTAHTTPQAALLELERAYGVKLTANYSVFTTGSGTVEQLITVGAFEEAHKAELHGHEGIAVPAYPLSMYPLNVQMIAACMVWEEDIRQHMGL